MRRLYRHVWLFAAFPPSCLYMFELVAFFIPLPLSLKIEQEPCLWKTIIIAAQTSDLASQVSPLFRKRFAIRSSESIGP